MGYVKLSISVATKDDEQISLEDEDPVSSNDPTKSASVLLPP